MVCMRDGGTKLQSTPYIIKVDKKDCRKQNDEVLGSRRKVPGNKPKPHLGNPPQQPTFYKYVLPGIDGADFMVQDIR